MSIKFTLIPGDWKEKALSVSGLTDAEMGIGMATALAASQILNHAFGIGEGIHPAFYQLITLGIFDCSSMSDFLRLAINRIIVARTNKAPNQLLISMDLPSHEDILTGMIEIPNESWIQRPDVEMKGKDGASMYMLWPMIADCLCSLQWDVDGRCPLCKGTKKVRSPFFERNLRSTLRPLLSDLFSGKAEGIDYKASSTNLSGTTPN